MELNLHWLDVTKTFRGKRALHPFELKVNAGESVGLLGENGSGKTTFLKLMAGLLTPTTGQILHDSPQPNAEYLAYCSDAPMFPDWLTISGVKIVYQGLYRNFDVDTFDRLCREFDLEDRKISGLSKGQRQRLKVAVTLAQQAMMYAFDEPLSGIDILSRRLILDRIGDKLKAGATMIISSHEIKDLEPYLSRCLILQQGQLVCDVTRNSLGEKSFLDVFFETSGFKH